jgi:thiol peroxidase
MATVLFKGAQVHLTGNLPSVHMKAPDFTLIDKDLHDHALHEWHGKKKILSTVPSLDTGVCSIMTKHLSEFAKKHPQIVVLTISADLPFAQKRFCEKEQVHNIVTLSTMRHPEFGKTYGLLMQDGPLKGLLARSLMVLDEKDHILHIELVGEITQEPNYHKAFALLS